MSSYIAASNQEMLWRTIVKNALFGESLTQEQQPIWFREIIGNFYNETNNKNLNNSELLELNKNTLRFMVHKLKQYAPQSAINEPINDRLQPQSSSYQGDYDRLQNNYNNMHKHDVPQEPDFKEPIDDEKITNMEELLQQQLRDRELDTPKPPLGETINPLRNQNESKKTPLISPVQRQNDDSKQISNNGVDKLMNIIEGLLLRTDNLEREMNVMRSQLIHQPSNEENLTLQL
jgi:hypothetical protein